MTIAPRTGLDSAAFAIASRYSEAQASPAFRGASGDPLTGRRRGVTFLRVRGLPSQGSVMDAQRSLANWELSINSQRSARSAGWHATALCAVLITVLASCSSRPEATPHPPPRCAPSDLVASAESWDEGLGKATSRLTVSTHSSRTCLIARNAGLALVDDSGRVLAEAEPEPSNASPLALNPGSAATAVIQWGNWCWPKKTPSVMRLDIPQTGSVSIHFAKGESDFVPPCGDASHGIALGLDSTLR